MDFQLVQKSMTLINIEPSKRVCNHRSSLKVQRLAHISSIDLLYCEHNPYNYNLVTLFVAFRYLRCGKSFALSKYAYMFHTSCIS